MMVSSPSTKVPCSTPGWVCLPISTAAGTSARPSTTSKLLPGTSLLCRTVRLIVACYAWAAPASASPTTPRSSHRRFNICFLQLVVAIGNARCKLGRLAAEAPLTAHLLPPLAGADGHLVRQQLVIALRARAGGGRARGARGMLLRLAFLVGGAGLDDDGKGHEGRQNQHHGKPHRSYSFRIDGRVSSCWRQWAPTGQATKARLGGLARAVNRHPKLQKYAMRRPHAAVANQIINDSTAQTRATVGNASKAWVFSSASCSRRPASSALRTPSTIKAALSWKTRLVATCVASAVNSTKPVAAINSRPKAAKRRAGRTTVAGGAAAKAPSSRASITTTELTNTIRARMCPSLAVI